MKNFKLLSMLLAAISLLFAGCAVDDVNNAVIGEGEDVTVTFTAQLSDVPGVKSRAAVVPGTAANVDKLSYFVYTKKGHEKQGNLVWTPTNVKETVDMTGLSTSVDITLARGVEYAIVFWADAFGFEDSPFKFNMETYELSIDFDELESNREDLDAFCGVFVLDGGPEAGRSYSLRLRRPFAQLNIGVDLQRAADVGLGTITSSGITLECVNTINFKTGEKSGLESRTFALAPLPSSDEYKFPVQSDTYSYLALNYIVPATTYSSDTQVTPVTINYEVGDKTMSRTINLPLQTNSRTNVYGDLLTVDSKLTVVVDERFGVEDTMDGDRSDEYIDVEYDSSKTELHMAGLFGGEITLTKDLDLRSPILVKKDLVVNLDRYTISIDEPSQDLGGKNVVFYVEDDATLTIKGFGNVKAESQTAPNYAVLLKDSWNNHLKIYGGSYDGNIEGNSDQIWIYGGGFKNNTQDLTSSLAPGLKLITIGDWICTASTEIPEDQTFFMWVEDHDGLRSAVSAGREGTQYRLHTAYGVSYIFYATDITVYSSLSGSKIDLGVYQYDKWTGGLFYETDVDVDSVDIKDGIKEIGDYAFCSYGMRGVKLPSTLEKIGDYAFSGCSFANPDNVVLPDTVTSIGKGAFAGTNISKIDFPASVTYFASKCMARFRQLQEVIIRAEEFTFEDASIFENPNISGPYEVYIYVANEAMQDYLSNLITDYAIKVNLISDMQN